MVRQDDSSENHHNVDKPLRPTCILFIHWVLLILNLKNLVFTPKSNQSMNHAYAIGQIIAKTTRLQTCKSSHGGEIESIFLQIPHFVHKVLCIHHPLLLCIIFNLALSAITGVLSLLRKSGRWVSETRPRMGGISGSRFSTREAGIGWGRGNPASWPPRPRSFAMVPSQLFSAFSSSPWDLSNSDSLWPISSFSLQFRS